MFSKSPQTLNLCDTKQYMCKNLEDSDQPEGKVDFACLLKTSTQNQSCTMTWTIAPSSLVACCPSHYYLNCLGYKASLSISFVPCDPAQTKAQCTGELHVPLRWLQLPSPSVSVTWKVQDFQTCPATGSVLRICTPQAGLLSESTSKSN